MNPTSIFYIIFIAIDILFAIPVILDLKRLVGAPAKYIRLVLALVLLAGAILVWVFLVYWTVDCWVRSLDPSLPKPYFFIVWFMVFVAFQALAGLGRVFVMSLRKPGEQTSVHQANP